MRTNLFELSCEDVSAVCVLFVDGRQVALGRGKALAKARPGARVRWAVIPRRRGASLLVTLKRGESTRVLFDGPCTGSIETGTLRSPATDARVPAAARRGPTRVRAHERERPVRLLA